MPVMTPDIKNKKNKILRLVEMLQCERFKRPNDVRNVVRFSADSHVCAQELLLFVHAYCM
jgi:hypothetical protein